MRRKRYPASKLLLGRIRVVDYDGGHDDGAVDRPSPVKLLERRTPYGRAGDHQARVQALIRHADSKMHVLEAEPPPGERKPSLVDRLLCAEQKPVETHAGGRRTHLRALARARYRTKHAVGQRCVLLRVDPNRRDLLVPRDRAASEAATVGDAADDAWRPDGLAALAGRDRSGGDAEPLECATRARAACDELASPLRYGAGDRDLFFGEELGLEQIERCRDRHDGGRYEAVQHCAKPP